MNRVMFSGAMTYTPAQLEVFAEAAVGVFLRAYGPVPPSKRSASRR